VPEVALVAAGYEGVAAAAEDDADLLVAGLSDRWRSEGLGLERWALARRTCASLLYVRRGLQPSRFAADGRETRYRWSTA
jgi:hypothetical protein